MSHAKVIVNGKTMLDGELSHWTERPPEYILELLNNPKDRTKPWQKYAGGALAEAITQNKPVTITITTNNSNGSWTMAVDYTQTHALTA